MRSHTSVFFSASDTWKQLQKYAEPLERKLWGDRLCIQFAFIIFSFGNKVNINYPDWDDVAGAVHHRQPRVHQHLSEQLDVALVFASQ